jgi:transcriptional regulator with XRE-family HTH domain
VDLDIGKNFKILRAERGESQSEMAEALGISVRFYQDIEQGRKEPSLSNLKKMLDRIKLPFARLWTADEPKVKPPDLVPLIEPILALGKLSNRKASLILALVSSDPSYLEDLDDSQFRHAQALLKVL